MLQSSVRCRNTQDKYLETGGCACRRSRHILTSRKRLAIGQTKTDRTEVPAISSVMLSHRKDIYTVLRNICLAR